MEVIRKVGATYSARLVFCSCDCYCKISFCPTNPFTYLEPQNPPVDFSYMHTIRGSKIAKWSVGGGMRNFFLDKSIRLVSIRKFLSTDCFATRTIEFHQLSI